MPAEFLVLEYAGGDKLYVPVQALERISRYTGAPAESAPLHRLGGVLAYGIPPFRLPREIIDEEIDRLRALGVEFRTNFIVGKTATIDELFEQGYSGVFIGTGAGLPHLMGVPGENLIGVYTANEYLTHQMLCPAC